ncbi:hypothetical protein D3C87_406020 [compost metagenome]
MRKKKTIGPSEFINLAGIEYFHFEEDFIEDNVRCIPMIVRFKMDAVGIKLKLSEWSKFNSQERVELAIRPISDYQGYLIGLIKKYTKYQPTLIPIDTAPAWCADEIPSVIQDKSREFKVLISLEQWNELSDIQRFALVKLCRSGHENKNFPKALVEFGLS